MKKRLVCVFVLLAMVLSFMPLKPLLTNAAENNGLSYDAAVAYKKVIDDAIKKYGKYTVRNYSGAGVGLVRLIDFDGNGTQELLIGCGCHAPGDEYFFEVYQYNNGLAKLTHTYACASMQLFFSMSLVKSGNKIYTETNSDGLCDAYSYYGTVEDGKWVTTEYYQHFGNFCDGSIHPELAGKDVYKIDGKAVTAAEAGTAAQMEKYKFYDTDPYSKYVLYGENGAEKAIETINEVINAKAMLSLSPIDRIKKTYTDKLKDIEAEAKNNFEDSVYYVYDINKDKTPELIVKRGTSEADYRFDVFSYGNDKLVYIGQLPAGHISLCSVVENGILLYHAHMGYEVIFEGNMSDTGINYKKVYEEDCSNKAYVYENEIDKFRSGAKILEKCNDLSNYTLLDKYFELMALEEEKITVTLDGKKITFDQNPIIVNGRTLVPLRAIFEELGATVNWDNNTQTVTSTKGTTTISMSIGKTEMYKNGKPIVLDVAPQLIGGRTLAPVRAVAESFDCKVDWDGDNRTVIIKTINAEKVISIAKNLYETNENLGGATTLASYAEVDTLLYNTLNEIDKTLAVNEFTLDMVSAGTTATIAAAKISTGNYSSMDNIGDGLTKLLTSQEIAEASSGVLKDAIKQRVFNEITSSVPDANALILNMGRSAYEDNSKMILDLIDVHFKFKSGNYTYDDAVAYIVLYDTMTINRKTMAMAVEVLSDELPQNFFESLFMSTETSIKTILNELFGNDFSGKGVTVSAELFTDIITAYTDYACSQSTDLFKYMKEINHPAVTEWANEFEVYKDNLSEKLDVK